MAWLDQLIWAVVGAIIGFVISKLDERFRFWREFKANNRIDLSGDDWKAAWQTSVDGEELLNVEDISLKQRGGIVRISNKAKSAQNPKAGYLWHGQLQFHHGSELMGWYLAIESEQSTNKGMMFLVYDSAKKRFVGQWTGSSYDGSLLSGFVVITKSAQTSLETLKTLTSKHRNKVRIVFENV